MTGWENFFIAEVGASAALAGLIFVGVSINLNRILSLPRLPDRALEAVSLLLTVLASSLRDLLLHQSDLGCLGTPGGDQPVEVEKMDKTT